MILTSRLLNLAALAFTICFSAFLLLGVDWGALHAKCLMAHSPGSCDILTVAVHAHPLHGRSPALVALAGTYVALCCLYWAWSAAAALGELRGVFETRDFVANKLGISERQARGRERECRGVRECSGVARGRMQCVQWGSKREGPVG